MAERRRLQGEIDRTLKKVHEGRTTFKETLDKFESATNHAQKEKHEADLKKEIKKLQRFRDSIKTWLQSGDIKDTCQLIETRKLIENDMERFKVIEKETKTKAFSKEGLFSDQKKDPMQKEKDEQLDWLRIQISKLQKKAETCDFDMHNINAKKKRNADRDRLGELGQRLAMYRSHIGKQEALLRLLDNDKIDLEKVRDLRFSFEEFLSNPDQEIYKSDQGMFMYDELNLDQLSADLTLALDQAVSDKDVPVIVDSLGFSVTPTVKETVTFDSVVVSEPLEDCDKSQSRALDKSKDRPPNKVKQQRQDGPPPRTISVTSTPIKSTLDLFYGPEYLLVHNGQDTPIKDTAGMGTTTLVSSQPVKTMRTPVLETVTVLESPAVIETVGDGDSVVKSALNYVDDTFSVLTSTATTMVTMASILVGDPCMMSPSVFDTPPLVQTAAAPPPPPAPPLPPPPTLVPQPPPQSSSMVHIPDQVTLVPSSASYYDHNTNYIIQQQQQQRDEINYQHMVQRLPPRPMAAVGADSTFDMVLEPGDAMSPFRNHNFQGSDAYNNQVIAMEHGRAKLPLSSDSEKARMIIYKNEMQVPDYFPKEPMVGSDTEDYYMHLDSDTLFFIFYYFEGTKAQFLAAKALKRMSWRFHTGHMCWFQRHEEPKQITDNSESGTYIFYDFESMSRQKKENFTFSYNYLEDKDL